MRLVQIAICLSIVGGILFPIPITQADPCGMVPPVYTGNLVPITRIGLQKTYVFHKDGVETFVIRPGFQGNVDNFGMLIPFPNPPSLRKVPDDIFGQIANAIDPPEVVIDLRVRRGVIAAGGGAMPAAAAPQEKKLEVQKDEVRVLKEEAVGMYEVAVLEAGSAAALQKWMDKNGYKYPEGMDVVTNDYVDIGWCFVAVKTKVGQASKVEPQPGQRNINPNLPTGSVFDGHVQGMGFRFKSKELVVPMRLSAFNEGELRNIVYLLTDSPRRIRSIPEEYVVRQISGQDLMRNLTQPLPLRIIGGNEENIPQYMRQGLAARRDPTPKNGKAKELFASDLLAVQSDNLSLEHEETEKELLRIGEHFGLRGIELDNENAMALSKQNARTTEKGLAELEKMTLTVVDGDFPREVIARENLTFANFDMPASRNNPMGYDAKLFGPGPKKAGVLKLGLIDWSSVEYRVATSDLKDSPQPSRIPGFLFALLGFAAIGSAASIRRGRKAVLMTVFLAAFLAAGSAFANQDNPDAPSAKELIENLKDSSTAQPAIEALTALAQDAKQRDSIVKLLVDCATRDDHLPRRGWAIATLAKIGGQDIDEYLLNIHADDKQEKIVRTWAAAARVSMTKTLNGLIEKANLIAAFPALGRPISMRIVESLTHDKEASAEQVMELGNRMPQLQTSLAPMIMAFGHEKLTHVMLQAKDNNIRRSAAGYLGAIAVQGNAEEVANAVVKELEFHPNARVPTWGELALFVPGIQWEQEPARQLVGNLIRWMVWCDTHDRADSIAQIHNNIRSLGLARAAGYQSPGWNDSSVTHWLIAWKKVVGVEGIREILKEQNLEKQPKYSAVLNDS